MLSDLMIQRSKKRNLLFYCEISKYRQVQSHDGTQLYLAMHLKYEI